MTIFAGVISVGSATHIPPGIIDQLVTTISRNTADRVERFEGLGYAIAKVDLGIFETPGSFVDSGRSLSLIAGNPIIEGFDSRNKALRSMHEHWGRGDVSALRATRGSFACVHFDPDSRRLWLATDKIGVRPVYLAKQGNLLFFSTALRILIALDAVDKRIQFRGAVEDVAFDFALGRRSPFSGIWRLRGGEVFSSEGGKLTVFPYWGLNEVTDPGLRGVELAQAMFQCFEEAVRLRVGADRSTVAMLSGGLDSRCVVSSLKAIGADVHTLNFAPAGSEDLEFGRLAAARLQTRHFELGSGPLNFLDRMSAIHAKWQRNVAMEVRPERPNLLWSGDGGDDLFGLNKTITMEVIETARRRPVAEATELLLRNAGFDLAPRVFARNQRDRIRRTIRDAIAEELDRQRCPDMARRLHLVLVANELRRVRDPHYEDIDLRRFELVTPFLDAEFVKLALAGPIEDFVYHRFYQRDWLAQFSPDTRSVPWQTYPGHEPCLITPPGGLRNQFESWYGKEDRAKMQHQIYKQVDKDLQDPNFPHWLLDRSTLRIALWMCRLGWGDYSYLFTVAGRFTKQAQFHQGMFCDGEAAFFEESVGPASSDQKMQAGENSGRSKPVGTQPAPANVAACHGTPTHVR